MGHVEGQSRHQSMLLPECLDDFVSADCAVRVIDAFVDSLDLKALDFARAVAANKGRPGYHPADLLKLYVYGYLHQLRSSRRLERECTLNIELLWLLRRLTPSHTTIADFRADNAAAIVGTCRQFTRFCRDQDLFAAQLVAIDGTKVQAVASRKQVVTAASIAREEAAIERRINDYLEAMNSSDAEEAGGVNPPADVAAALQRLRARQDELCSMAGELKAEGVKQRVNGEPEARLMRSAQGHKVAYNAQAAVDTEHHLIVHAEVTSDGNDHQQLQPMAEAAKAVLKVDSLTVVADTGYANGQQARGCTEGGITPIVPRPAVVNPRNKDCFTRAAFTYDPATDTYTCPAGQLLSPHRRSVTQGAVEYWNSGACQSCPLKAQCTASRYRVIVRSDYEADLEAMHQRAMQNREVMTARHAVVEHPFGTMKWMMGHPRFLVRGLRKVRGEFALVVLGYNLKRVMAILGVAELIRRLQAPGSTPAMAI